MKAPKRFGERKELRMNLGKVVISGAVLLLAMGCGVKNSKAERQKRTAAPAADVEKKSEKDARAVEALILSVADRQAIYKSFSEALKANYTFQTIKSKSIDAHVKACADIEAKAPLNAWVNLRFEDRFRECLAALQDAHLQLRTRGPKVMTGVTLREIDRRFFIESIRSDDKFSQHYEARLKRDIREVLKPGTEVTVINGGSIEKQLEPLESKISASTGLARRELAVEALTQRNFQYPKSSTLRLTITKEGKSEEITLDWYNEETQETVAREYFGAVKIEAAPFAIQTPGWLGYSAGSPLLKNLTELTDDAGRIVLRRGELEDKDGKLCYIQLLSFKPAVLYTPDGARASFADAIGLILESCENKGQALLLDLRSNDGGNIENAESLMRLVAKKEKSDKRIFTTGLKTRNFLALNVQAGGAYATAADTAHAKKLSFLPLIFGSNIVALKEPGFTQPLAVIISPRCMSACDAFAAFIDATGRGALVGQPTAGAFGALTEVRGEPRSVWIDQQFNTFSVEVPNSFMGVLTEPLKEGEKEVLFDLTKHMPEGKAIAPKEGARYRLTVEDLLSNGAGILGKARAFLKTP